jgi:hyperosmotically inducible protein
MKPGIFLSLLLVFALVVPVLAASKQVSDDVLTDSVRRKLANDQIVKGGGLEVIVKEGVVTMRGSVEYDKQKQRAAKVAKKVSGVKSVINELTVRRPGQ